MSALLTLFIVAAAQVETPRYAFYAYTWEGTGGGNGYRQFNIAYYFVSVPDGIRALAHSSELPKLASISPDGRKSIVYDTFGRQSQSGSIIDLWEQTTQTFTFEYGLTYPYVWSPDSKYITAGIIQPACNCDDYALDIGIVDVTTGALRILTEGEFLGGAINWSPDGKMIAYVDRRSDGVTGEKIENVKVIPVDGSQPPRIIHTFTSKDEWIDPLLYWSSDGSHISLLVRGRDMAAVWYVDVQTAHNSFHRFFSDVGYGEYCWSTLTDHFIAASMTEFELIALDASQPLDTSFIDPSLWQLLPGASLPCEWSPDGTKLALVYSRGTRENRLPPGVKLIDFAARQVKDIDIQIDTSFWTAYWSHDSRMLALRSYSTSRAPNDVYIYDTVTMQQVLAQTELEFISWIASPPA